MPNGAPPTVVCDTVDTAPTLRTSAVDVPNGRAYARRWQKASAAPEVVMSHNRPRPRLWSFHSHAAGAQRLICSSGTDNYHALRARPSVEVDLPRRTPRNI